MSSRADSSANTYSALLDSPIQSHAPHLARQFAQSLAYLYVVLAQQHTAHRVVVHAFRNPQRRNLVQCVLARHHRVQPQRGQARAQRVGVLAVAGETRLKSLFQHDAKPLAQRELHRIMLTGAVW